MPVKEKEALRQSIGFLSGRARNMRHGFDCYKIDCDTDSDPGPDNIGTIRGISPLFQERSGPMGRGEVINKPRGANGRPNFQTIPVPSIYGKMRTKTFLDLFLLMAARHKRFLNAFLSMAMAKKTFSDALPSMAARHKKFLNALPSMAARIKTFLDLFLSMAMAKKTFFTAMHEAVSVNETF